MGHDREGSVTAELVVLGQQALFLALLLSLPPLAAALLAGLVTATMSAFTQIQDSSLAHLPRLVAVALTLALLAPWMSDQITTFATQAFSGG